MHAYHFHYIYDRIRPIFRLENCHFNQLVVEGDNNKVYTYSCRLARLSSFVISNAESTFTSTKYSTKTKMIFEKASDKDISQLFELMETCYRGDKARMGWTHESDLVDGNRTTEALLLEEITVPGGNYLKYTNEDGKIVGCVYTVVEAEARKCFVGSLCVHPTIQSQGLGKKLMSAAEDLAKESGCTKLCMKVLTKRAELIAWYEKLGFKYIGQNYPFPEGCGIPKVPLELGSWEKQLE